jgi:hypothetical protein
LGDAIDVVLAASMLELTAGDAPGAGDKLPDISALLANFDEPGAVAEAVGQVMEFVKRYETPERFIEAMGLPEEEEQQETRA